MFKREKELIEKINLSIDLTKVNQVFTSIKNKQIEDEMKRKNDEECRKMLLDMISSLLNSAATYQIYISSASHKLRIENSNAILDTYRKLEAWNNDLSKLENLKSKYSSFFREKAINEGYMKVKAYETKFNTFLSFKHGFMTVVSLHRDIIDKKVDESNVKYLYTLYYEKVYQKLSKTQKEYVSTELYNKLNEINTIYNHVITTETFFDKVSKYIHSYSRIPYSPTDTSAYGKVNDIKQQGLNILDEYEKYASVIKILSFGKFKAEYENAVKRIINEAELLLSQISATIDEIHRKNKVIKAFYLITKIVFFGMLGFFFFWTIGKTIYDYSQSIKIGWAIVFGLIVGILYGVVRALGLFGFGALMWPGCYSTMFGTRVINSPDNVMLILNLVFILFAILFMIFSSVTEKKHLNSDSFTTEELSITLVVLLFAAIIVRVVWGGIKGLVVAWSDIYVINAVFGLFVGIFQVIMLIFGAGYWWDGLYNFSSMNGEVLNTILYTAILLVITFHIVSYIKNERIRG